jgi:N-acetylneuraminic acid mutarotase
MKYLKFVVLLIIFFVSGNCNKEAEVKPKDYPYVITEIPEINKDGALLSANIENIGNMNILKYGFVWGTSEKPTINDYNILFTDEAKKGTYCYIVRAYIKTDKYEVYGNTITFKSEGSLSPLITDFSPKKGYARKKVIIQGQNFTRNEDQISVKFGDTEATIDSANTNTIYVKSPLITENKKVRISVTIAEMADSSDSYYDVFYAWTRKKDFPGGTLMEGISFAIDGTGYVVSGINGLHAIWAYNPVTDEWNQKSGVPPAPLFNGISSFVIGGKAYVNGLNYTRYYKYEPIADSWTLATGYPRNEMSGTVAFVIDNIVYIGTGRDYNAVYNEFFKYNPNPGVWNRIADFPGKARYYATGFTLNGKGYVCLGEDYPAFYNEVWEYDPGSDTWARKNDFPGPARGQAVAFVLKSKAYLGIGTREFNSMSPSYTDMWEYQEQSDTWVQKDPYPGNGKWKHIVLSVNNRVFIGAGNSAYHDYKDIWEFDPNLE